MIITTKLFCHVVFLLEISSSASSVLSSKEAAFAVNELSELHYSGIHFISSLFPPKSAAFLRVPVSLGRARSGIQESLMGWDT